MDAVYTPPSYNTRVQAALRAYNEVGEGRLRLPERTAEEVAARHLGDAERMAITTLYQATRHGWSNPFPFRAHTALVQRYLLWLTDSPANALGFRWWLEAGAPHHVLVKPEAGRYEDETPPTLAVLAADGALTDPRVIEDALSEGRPADKMIGDHMGKRRARYYARIDYALLTLAEHLAQHRLTGEADLEATTEVFGGLATMTSSLAARVIEFWRRAAVLQGALAEAEE